MLNRQWHRQLYGQIFCKDDSNRCLIHTSRKGPCGGQVWDHHARLKFGGGTGGHNGLKDIQAHLGSAEFWRLRIGIGHPRDLASERKPIEVVDYVLKKPRKEEQVLLESAVDKALGVIPLILAGDMQNATQILHTNC